MKSLIIKVHYKKVIAKGKLYHKYQLKDDNGATITLSEIESFLSIGFDFVLAKIPSCPDFIFELARNRLWKLTNGKIKISNGNLPTNNINHIEKRQDDNSTCSYYPDYIYC